MYYVLTRNGNTFIGLTKDNPYTFNIENISIHEFDGRVPDLNQYVWNYEIEDFERNGTIYTKREFLSKFTLMERSAIRASTDPIVVDIMNMLEMAEYVDVTAAETQQGVGYLALTGLIAAERVQEILT